MNSISFEEQIAKYNNWTLVYTNKVIQEYERFMHLKSINSTNISLKLIPSDDIDKLWQYHILSTELYYNYCMNKFNKIIHYNPSNAINPFCLLSNLNERREELLNTLKCYKLTYQNFINPEVWNTKLTLCLSINDIEKNINLQYQFNLQPNQFNLQPNQFNLQPNQFVQPSYLQNKPEKDQIKIYIYYTNQILPGLYNKQIIQLLPSETDTIDKLKDLIALELKINKTQIKISPHSEILPYTYRAFIHNNELNQFILLKNLIINGCNFFIIEIN
jgi:hypothetical protein